MIPPDLLLTINPHRRIVAQRRLCIAIFFNKLKTEARHAKQPEFSDRRAQPQALTNAMNTAL